MNTKTLGEGFATMIVIFVIAALVMGQFLGQPVLFGFVSTSSMEPTMEPGDGFVALPTELAGPIEKGDIVVFEAKDLHDGGLTTHRVVEVTERGFITKGDANPFTDQDDREPPVRKEQVVAKTFQVGGKVVVIPGLGTAVMIIRDAMSSVQQNLAAILGTGVFLGPQGFGLLVGVVALGLFGYDVVRESGNRRRTRRSVRETGINARFVIGLLVVALVVSATASMVAPSGATEFQFLSTDNPADRQDVIGPSSSKTNELALTNGGLVPTVVYFEPSSEMTQIEPRRLHLSPQSDRTVEATFRAPRETGVFRRYVVEHRYLALLPQPVIRSLYRAHPWAPIVAIDALVAGAFLAVTLPFAPSGRIRNRTRNAGSTLNRYVRRFKRLF